MQMLLKCEIVEIAKQLRNIDFRNFIKFKSNFEVLHEIFLKKFTNKLVVIINNYFFKNYEIYFVQFEIQNENDVNRFFNDNFLETDFA